MTYKAEQRNQWFFEKSRKSKELFQKWSVVSNTSFYDLVAFDDILIMKSNFIVYRNILPALKMEQFQVAIPGNDKTLGKKEVVSELIQNPMVVEKLGLPTSPVNDGEDAHNVDIFQLRCSAITMNFLEYLIECDLITDDGHMRGCMDEDIDGIVVQDKLRKYLAHADVSNSSIPNDVIEEFLFHLLRIVVVGGAMCQAEYEFTEYMEATKSMYKDLVRIRRKSDGGIIISSKVFHVDPNGRNMGVFHRESVHNRFYAVVNEGKEEFIVNFVYVPYIPFW